MSEIPIFIIVHDQYEILKKSVESYEKYIKTPFKIIFHDVASTYLDTLDYLKQKRTEGHEVYRSEINNHHTVINSVKDYIQQNPDCEYCVITDPDIELNNVRGDILQVYIHTLNKLNKTSVGPMLEIHDIPDHYPRKKLVLEGHGKQFWNKPRQQISFKTDTFQYIDCNTDTTFQLFSARNIPKTFPHANSVRFLSPYSARHLDWYIDPNNLTKCQEFYLENTTSISHWNNNNWKGQYHNKSIPSLVKK